VTGTPPHDSPAQIRGPGDGIVGTLPAPVRDDSTYGACVSLHTCQRPKRRYEYSRVIADRSQT